MINTRNLVFIVVLAQSRIKVQGIPHWRFRDYLSQSGDPLFFYGDEVQHHDFDDFKSAAVENDFVQESYHTQRVDHYDPTNPLTYQQRYFYSPQYVLPSAAKSFAFLCVGGEGPPLDVSVLIDSVHCSGDMLELAKRLNNQKISVHLFALEHRYYGKSYPVFPNNESPVTNHNLKFLSSRQAQEDLAHFVTTERKFLPPGTLWVSFGGSYPGFMAAMARLKYPHLIYAAVSNSAPLDIKVDFPGYKQRVGWDLRYEKIGGSLECFNIVKNGHNQAADMVHKDPKSFSKLFNLCDNTDLTVENNVNMLLGDGLIDIPAQSNDPSCHADDPDKLCNIERICHFMEFEDYSSKTDLERLAVIAQKQNPSGECISVNWDDTLAELSKPVVNDDAWRSWLWQTCTEVGFYQTCLEDCPFTSFYHLVEMDLELCEVAFGVTNVYDNVQAMIEHYGGMDLEGSRIISVNGNVDPWSVLGLKTTPKFSLPVYEVDGASHHFWTHKVKDTDSSEIVQIRELIYSTVMGWLDLEEELDYEGKEKGIPLSEEQPPPSLVLL